MEGIGELLQRFVAAVETGDGSALADCFTPDGVYDDYFFGPRHGRDGISATLAHFYKGGKAFRWEFTEVVSDGRRAFAAYRFSYRSTHPDANNARVIYDGIARLELRDGLIAHYSEIFDRGMALAQQNFEPSRIVRIANRYADEIRTRPEWKSHLE